MITGSIIFFAGILIGFYMQPVKNLKKTFSTIVGSKEASIIDLTDDIDLGQEENN